MADSDSERCFPPRGALLAPGQAAPEFPGCSSGKKPRGTRQAPPVEETEWRVPENKEAEFIGQTSTEGGATSKANPGGSP